VTSAYPADITARLSSINQIKIGHRAVLSPAKVAHTDFDKDHYQRRSQGLNFSSSRIEGASMRSFVVAIAAAIVIAVVAL
jgi:hypothetical protein